ncbi:MAG: DegV family protein [Anaerolineae bacterium]
MTSGLSGTFNAAKAGAELVPEANVTVVDTKTVSAATVLIQVAGGSKMKRAAYAPCDYYNPADSLPDTRRETRFFVV